MLGVAWGWRAEKAPRRAWWVSQWDDWGQLRRKDDLRARVVILIASLNEPLGSLGCTASR